MSNRDKTLEKVLAKPVRSDIKWNDLVALLKRLGYTALNSSGSRRKFFNATTKALISCHQPHPSPDVDKGCIASIAEHLIFHGHGE